MNKEEYVETFLNQIDGAERGDWDWDDDADLPKFLPRSVEIRGHDKCGLENNTMSGKGYGFRVGWLEEAGVQGVRVGGDWEHPVQGFAFRWPDNTIMGEPEGEIGAYIPRDGNLFNPHSGRPLGNDTYNENKDGKWLCELGLEDSPPEYVEAHAYDLTQFLDYEAMFFEFQEWLNDRKT